MLTIIGGAVFGLWWGVILVSFASSIGATLSFLLSRFILQEWVQARFGRYLTVINEGIERDGAFYLFSLRLIPFFPFFAINLVFGLTPIRTWTYYWVSQVGMFAATVIYVNVGAQLASIDELSASGILSLPLIAALIAVGIFPLVVKKMMAYVQAKRLAAKEHAP